MCTVAARALVADKHLCDQLAVHAPGGDSSLTTDVVGGRAPPRVRVHNLRGGVLAWAHAQREFLGSSSPNTDADGDADGDGGSTVSRTRALHVYGRRWDLAPSNYETTWYTMLGWT